MNIAPMSDKIQPTTSNLPLCDKVGGKKNKGVIKLYNN